MQFDGQTATNPRTGERVVYRGGQWQPANGMAPRRVYGPAPQPSPQTADQARQDEAQAGISAGELTFRREHGGMSPAEWNQQQQLIQDNNQGLARINAASEHLLNVGRLYRENLEGGGVADSILESLPDRLSETNSRFNSAASALTRSAWPFLRVPGEGTQSDRDVIEFNRGNLPQAQQWDSTIEQRIDNLATMVNEQRKIRNLPPVDWRRAGGPPERADRSARPISAAEPRPEVRTSTRTRSVRDPELYRVGAQISQMLINNVPDQEIRRVHDQAIADARRRGLNISDQTLNNALTFRRTPEWRQYRVRRRQSGLGYPISREFHTYDVPLEGFSRTMAEVSSSAPGALAINSANAVTGGWLDDGVAMANGDDPAITNEAMAALRAENPGSSLAGDVMGQAIAAYGLGRFIPGGNAVNPLARGAIANDVAYGAIRGAGDAAPGDAFSGAVTGAITNAAGGIGGRRLGNALASGARGVQDESVRYLADRGVPLTLGQMAGRTGRVGQFAQGMENRLSGFPIVGDMVAARQLDAMDGFNRAAFDQALAPIGANTGGQIGADGVAAGQGAIRNAYDDALRGVSVNADPQFVTDMAAIRARGAQLPLDHGQNYSYIADNQVGSLFGPGGELSGENFQAAMGLLRRERGAVGGVPLGQAYRDALTDTEGGISDLVERQAPGVTDQLWRANSAFRNNSIIGDAVMAARGSASPLGSSAEVFTPAQLGNADVSNTMRFGGRNAARAGNTPFYDLRRHGSVVLPNRVPDSGTAGRQLAGSLALPAATAAAGAGTAYATGADPSTGAAVGAGVAGLYTRRGQALMRQIMLNRPVPIGRVRSFLRRHPDASGVIIQALHSSGGGATARALEEDYRRDRRR